MIIRKYLVVTQGKTKYSSPKVKLINDIKNSIIQANSVVLKLNLELPDSLFQKPQLEATIVIDKNMVSQPTINADVIDNIKDVLKQQLGAELLISVVEAK